VSLPVKDHIQEGSPKVNERSSNGPLYETDSNRCFNLDLWLAAIRQWSERKSDLYRKYWRNSDGSVQR